MKAVVTSVLKSKALRLAHRVFGAIDARMNTTSVLSLLLCVAPCASVAQQWAFQKPACPPVPLVRQAAWVKNPIDAFVLQKLEQHGLKPSSPADKLTLLRRVTVDLTGLPPAPEEIAAFQADTSTNAYDKVVKRLLNSKHFGERWAQHWLDVARFAESNGYEHDLDRPQAWRYRDWVVDALNADKPYNRFVQEQVAGDLLTPGDFNMHIATGFLRTGPMHITGGNLDPTEMRQEWLTEAVAGIGNGILGLTIGCARCHNHKFDPIPQTDYYRLQAFFAATANKDTTRASDTEKKTFDEAVKAIKVRTAPIEAQISVIEKPYRESLREQKKNLLAPEYRAALAVESSRRTPEQKRLAGEAGTQLAISWDEVVAALSKEDRARRSALRQQIFAIERELPDALPEAEGVGDTLSPAPPMHLLVRGDVHSPGPEITPGFPICLQGAQAAPPDAAADKPRLTLARWLTATDNPLTARVFVNRIWQHLFGKGLVSTPNDFGKNGQPPTHPELLDWLATTFIANGANSGPRAASHKYGCGWSTKAMIALIVTSSTYRQACEFDQARAAVDPDNRLLWRMNRKRLDAESLRDSILAAVGTLSLQLGGPSVHVPLEPEVYDTIFTESEPDNLWPTTADTRQHTRRSLYLFRKRNVRLPMLAVFDQPDMMSSCAARGQTVHALQALTLINSDFMRKQSFLLAKRLYTDVPEPTAQPATGLHVPEHPIPNTQHPHAHDVTRRRLNRLFTLTFGRPPRADELKATEKFMADQTAALRAMLARKESLPLPMEMPPGTDAGAFLALSDLCLATLNLNEFMYLR